MIIAISANYVDALDKYLSYYSEDALNCKFVFFKQDVSMLQSKGRESYDFTTKDVVDMANRHNIKDYKIRLASDIANVLPDECKGDFFNLVKNMICPMLAPWYVNKYIDNTEDILWCDEDVLIRLNKEYINYLSNQPDNLAYFYGDFNNATTECTECGRNWCEIMGMQPTNANTFKISFKHTCGAPQYYKYNSFDSYDEYVNKVFTNSEMYKLYSKTKTYHHNFIDEYFRSCAPVTFKPFDKEHFRIEFVGDKSLERFNPSYKKELWTNGVIHLAGSNKLIKLDKVVKNMEVKYGTK